MSEQWQENTAAWLAEIERRQPAPTIAVTRDRLPDLLLDARDTGRCPSGRRWDAQHQRPSVPVFVAAFGSWSAALRAAWIAGRLDKLDLEDAV